MSKIPPQAKVEATNIYQSAKNTVTLDTNVLKLGITSDKDFLFKDQLARQCQVCRCALTLAGERQIKVETATEQLLFSTLRIVATREGGLESVGTGFIVYHEWAQDAKGPFLVTNKHVVQETTTGHLTFTQMDNSTEELLPAFGSSTSISLSGAMWQWTGHPSDEIDVAVLPLAPTLAELRRGIEKPFYKSISTQIMVGRSELASLDAVEEVIFVGYPSGIFDQINNLPIFRKGITATPPSVDYEGMPIFLIDASVFPGSSGSPVFIYNNGYWSTRDGTPMVGQRIFCLGVLGKVYYNEDNNVLRLEEVLASVRPIVKTTQMIDLGIVYKSRTVIETIEEFLRQHGELLPVTVAGPKTQ